MVPPLGVRGAAELAGCFLRDVASAIEAVPAEVERSGYAVYAPEGTEAALRAYLPPSFRLLCRRHATLGQVLLGAVEHLLGQGHDCVALVNADSPTLPPSLIADAVAAIRAPGPGVVLGPATDGGYYLIALKQPHPELFTGIPWSTPQVFRATLARAESIGLPVVSLTPWYDVDDAATMRILLRELRDGSLPFDTRGRRGGAAEATRRFLSAHPGLADRLEASTTPEGAAVS